MSILIDYRYIEWIIYSQLTSPFMRSLAVLISTALLTSPLTMSACTSSFPLACPIVVVLLFAFPPLRRKVLGNVPGIEQETPMKLS